MQEVETHEDVGVVVAGQNVVGGDLPIEGSFVGESLVGEVLVVGVVDVSDAAPQPDEPLLELAVVGVGEVAEESAYEGALFVGEVGHVVEFMQVAHVCKHTVGRGHVLVDIVEVGEQ